MAGVDVTRRDIQAMGVGGLLMEIFSRPQPRAPDAAAAHPQVAAVVLAAGSSRRMGHNKLLADLGGKPIVRHVVEAALASRASPVIVVLGHDADRVRACLSGLDVRFADNPDHASGMASSVKSGLRAVPDTAAAAVVLLGDMPRISPALIDQLLNAYAGQWQAQAIVPVSQGRRGNPVVLARALFTKADALSGDIGARRLLEAAGDAVLEVPIDDEAILMDVDTPEALASAQAANS